MLYANTHSQVLEQHLFAVGYIAEKLCRRFYPDGDTFAKAIFIAGCLHDLGKVDPGFQKWAVDPKNKNYLADDGYNVDATRSKFNFEKHPRHNEISLLLYHLLDDYRLKSVNKQNKKSIRHSIYWHHAKPFRKDQSAFQSLGQIYEKLDKNSGGKAWDLVMLTSLKVIEKVGQLDCQYRRVEQSILQSSLLDELDEDRMDDIEALPTPSYKEYKDEDEFEKYRSAIKINGINDIFRACLITADRWVSALSDIELNSSIKYRALDNLIDSKFEPKSILDEHIQNCLMSFPDTERTHEQSRVAKNLNEQGENGVAVLAGAAGCGKTKIALEWAMLKGARQILWICPRVLVCQGLFEELVSDHYLPQAKVEIHTGEFKYINSYANPTPQEKFFSGDVVITTIDQILNSILSHTNANKLIDYINAHIVFDEFHEYINMTAFNLLFSELLSVKQLRGRLANTLLVSATPNYLFVDEFLDIRLDEVEKMPSFNESRYRIDLHSYDESTRDAGNPLYRPQPDNSIVISNTALTAQKSFIQNHLSENAVLLHSKFKKSDKKNLFKEVFASFRQNGSRKFDLLRSGPIVQASLNITCDHMVSEISTAENCLQRLGRLDRFGENKKATNIFVLAVADPIAQGRRSGNVAHFLSHQQSFLSTRSWYQFLCDQDLEKSLTLKQIYQLYESFYQTDNEHIRDLKKDMTQSLKASVKLVNQKVIDPRIIRSKKGENRRSRISRNSLRGDNRFVQMALCDVSAPDQPKILDSYAYEIPVDKDIEIDNLTESLSIINECDLLAYAARKHDRIVVNSVIKGIPASKMNVRKVLLERYARDPEHPIYLSYTPNDLLEKLGEKRSHREAICYAICDAQAVGAISIKNLS